MALKPPVEVPQGAIRLNTDSQKLEFFAQDQWWEMATTESSPIAGRAIWWGGYTYTPEATDGNSNIIEYTTIQTLGDAVDFGDATVEFRDRRNGAASYTRGISGGGTEGNPSPAIGTTIEYITIASAGDAIDFGNLGTAARGQCALSNSTRGLFAGGSTPSKLQTIEYITITSTGNAADFGDMTDNKTSVSTCASGTRGILAGGFWPSFWNVIEHTTIATLGNAIDGADLTSARAQPAGCSNSVRGLLAGGYTTPSSPLTPVNTIDYITIASLGNAMDFGDLMTARYNVMGASDSTRAVFAGGVFPSNGRKEIQYVNIETKGDTLDFGDCVVKHEQAGSVSNAHGGLG